MKIIGDVHGKIDEYVRIARNSDYSIQLGDMGFKQHCEKLMSYDISPDLHKFIPGNHDDYDNLPPHSLKDFGYITHGGVELFYIRGAGSIDKHLRIPYISWWPNE